MQAQDPGHRHCQLWCANPKPEHQAVGTGKMWKSNFPPVDQTFYLQVLSSAHSVTIDILAFLL